LTVLSSINFNVAFLQETNQIFVGLLRKNNQIKAKYHICKERYGLMILLNKTIFTKYTVIYRHTDWRIQVIHVETNNNKNFIMINNHVMPEEKKGIYILIELILLENFDIYDYVLCGGDFNTEHDKPIRRLNHIQLNNGVTSYKSKKCEDGKLKTSSKSVNKIDKLYISNNIICNGTKTTSYFDHKDNKLYDDGGEYLKKGPPFCDPEKSIYKGGKHMCILQDIVNLYWPSDHAMLLFDLGLNNGYISHPNKLNTTNTYANTFDSIEKKTYPPDIPNNTFQDWDNATEEDKYSIEMGRFQNTEIKSSDTSAPDSKKSIETGRSQNTKIKPSYTSEHDNKSKKSAPKKEIYTRKKKIGNIGGNIKDKYKYIKYDYVNI
jgi:hypothetical protein